MTWNKSLIDNTWEVGSGPSFQYFVLNQNNYPAGVIKSTTGNQMLYVWFDGTSWQNEEARPSTAGGWAGASIALLSNGDPVIAFMAFDELKLRYKSSGVWTEALLYNANDVESTGTAIVVDSNDTVYVGFVDDGGTDGFRVISGTVPSVTTILHLDELGTGNVKGAIGPNDRPWFVYERSGNPARYTHFDGVVWNDGEIKSSTPKASTKPSVAIGPTNEVHMAYRDSNSDTGYTHYDGSFTHENITESHEPENTTIDVDKDNEPHVAIDSATDTHLYYYNKSGVTWVETDVDNTHENVPVLKIDTGLGGKIYTDGSIYQYKLNGFPIFNTLEENTLSENSITIDVAIHEAGDVYGIALAEGSSAPSSSDVKNGVGAIATDSEIALAAGSTATLSFTGLDPSTTYDFYFVTENTGDSILQDEPSFLQKTTAAAAFDFDIDVTSDGIDMTLEITNNGSSELDVFTVRRSV